MCGIIGIFSSKPVNQDLYDGLLVLQHRGQDAAGIVTCDNNNKLSDHKGIGLVRDVFQAEHMATLVGNMGIGHVRYPTAGTSSCDEAQPFYVNSPLGISLGHNGNLINADELKKELFSQNKQHLNTESDSEILLNVFAHELRNHMNTKKQGMQLDVKKLFDAVKAVHGRCRGAYAAIVMIAGQGILAFRDVNGVRPLVYGYKEGKQGKEYMVASESVALDMLGFNLIDDIHPSEAIFIDVNGKLHKSKCSDNPKNVPCIFEYVYFSRPDSYINRINVQKSRMRMGTQLGKKILKERPEHDIDVVIPIPDTSRTAALEMARILKLEYREGFIKNRYIGRTFIMPGQKMRKKSVKQKLNPIGLEYKGKNVLLVDDSIVRGTTSKELVQMARDAGAKKVYFASASPPVRYPNIHGIDMPVASELIAHGKTIEQVCEKIGADRLIYQDLEDLISAVKAGNPLIQDFECSVFNGENVTEVDKEYFDKLAKQRNDAAKQEDAKNNTTASLFKTA